MPTKSQNPPPAKQVTDDRQAPVAAIRENLLRVLGRPANLFRVEVRRLWADHYRVNVLVGADASALTIAHSYFVVADESGAVTTSEPALTRQYEA